MKKKFATYLCSLVVLTLLIWGCSTDPVKKDYTFKPDELKSEGENSVLLISEGESQIGEPLTLKKSELSYVFNEVPALDYLRRKGEHVSKDDLEDLKGESVFMLEIKEKDRYKKITDSPFLKLSKDELGQYMVGKIVDDFRILQGGKTFKPNGSSYQNTIGNKIRVSFYMKDVDLSKEFKIEYNDRVFGAGLMRIKKYRTN